MKHTFTTWMRTIASCVPSWISTPILLGVWLGLTIVFTLLGSILLLTVQSALEPTVGPASVLVTVIGVYGTPVASLLLAQVVLSAMVERFEADVVRELDSVREKSRFGSDGTKEQVDCHSSRACCC